MKMICVGTLGTLAIFACLLLCTPALADPWCGGVPLTTVKEGIVSGGLWFDHSNPMVTNLTEGYTLPSCTGIQWARLYVGVYCGHMKSNYQGRANITFNGVQLGGTLDGLSSEVFNLSYTYPGEGGTGPAWINDHCVRVTSDYLMWYNVTELVAPDSDVWVKTWRKEDYSGFFDGRIVVVTLVVAYNDGDSDTITYWVNQGHDVDNYYWDSYGPNYIGETNFTVDPSIVSTAENVNLTVVHKASIDGAYTFNGISIPTDPNRTTTPPGENWQGPYSGNNIWHVASLFNSIGNNTLTYDHVGSFYKIFLAFLTVNEVAGPVDNPNLTVTTIAAYHNNICSSPWFNISNEVDVAVKNNGTAGVEAFNVSLYVDGDLIGKKTMPGLEVGEITTVQFKWAPVGDDCFGECSFTNSSRDYELKAIVDCDNDIIESSEANNDKTVVETVYYNGYVADEPLENVAQGTLHGGLIFTTGDGEYSGLYSIGSSIDTTYEITLPAAATVKLARLNVYYTWQYATSCPEMEVSRTYDGNTYVLPVDKKYGDASCWGPWNLPWGNYVFNLTDHIQGSGTYTITVERTGGASFCIAAPGIEMIYEDKTRPLIEYWINEGADVLIGGSRCDGGCLSLEDCLNNATFPASSSDTRKVTNATLGVVSPWAGCAWASGTTNYLYFNGIELGSGVYHGYDSLYNTTIDGLTMHIGSTNAQVGVNVTDVTGYLNPSDNVVGQGDGGDCMMPANAFLVVTYGEEE